MNVQTWYALNTTISNVEMEKMLHDQKWRCRRLKIFSPPFVKVPLYINGLGFAKRMKKKRKGRRGGGMTRRGGGVTRSAGGSVAVVVEPMGWENAKGKRNSD